MNMNPKVDIYVSRATNWHEEIEKLRTILLECQLTEELKWGKPCYTSQGKNIVIIQGFKAYCALLFFKGVLLQDPHGVLVKTGENTLVGRQIRFTDTLEIARMESILKEYVAEAIEVEKSGLKVDVQKSPELSMPEEFQAKLDGNPALGRAFTALTPGRQKAYLMYFSSPKQSKTREARIEKCVEKILNGEGLNDR